MTFFQDFKFVGVYPNNGPVPDGVDYFGGNETGRVNYSGGRIFCFVACFTRIFSD